MRAPRFIYHALAGLNRSGKCPLHMSKKGIGEDGVVKPGNVHRHGSAQALARGQAARVARDVNVTRRIYDFGCQNGFVQYYTRLGSKQKVKVNWKC